MQSHQNDPLGAAIVNEVIKIIKNEKLIPKAERMGVRLFRELIDKGYIAGNRKSFFRIDPPLTIKEDEFKEFVCNFKAILTPATNI